MNKKRQVKDTGLAPWMKWGALLIALVLLIGVIVFALYQKNILAIVNGEKIRVDDVKEQLGQYAIYDENVEPDNVYYQSHIAPYVAFDRLLLQEAENRGIVIEADKIAEEAADTLKYLEIYFLYDAADEEELEPDAALLYGNDEEEATKEKERLEAALNTTADAMVDAKLKEVGLSREYFQKAAHSSLSIGELRTQIKDELIFADDEIEEFYQENLEDKYIEKNTSHILVDLEDEELAEEIYEKLMDGADWKEMSDTYSTDEVAKKSEGNIGFYARSGNLVKEYIDGAFLLEKDGEISRPVKTQFGYHIIRLEETRTLELDDDLKDNIKTELTTGKINLELVKIVDAAKVSPEKTKDIMIQIAQGE